MGSGDGRNRVALDGMKGVIRAPREEARYGVLGRARRPLVSCQHLWLMLSTWKVLAVAIPLLLVLVPSATDKFKLAGLLRPVVHLNNGPDNCVVLEGPSDAQHVLPCPDICCK